MDRKEYQKQWYAQRKAKLAPAVSGEMVCKKCGETKKVTAFGTHPNMKNGRRTTCKPCRSKETLEWFNAGGKKFRTAEKKKQYKAAQIEKFPEKYHARNLLASAIYSGKIVAKTSCERCGCKGLLHGHHDNYDQPLEVEWLCVPCHTKEHLDK